MALTFFNASFRSVAKMVGNPGFPGRFDAIFFTISVIGGLQSAIFGVTG
jgi:hypothetical protein